MIEYIAREIPKSQEKLNDSPNESTVKETYEIKVFKSPLEYSMNTIENQSLESLKIQNQIKSENKILVEKESSLTDEEKQKIKTETGWSDEIIDSISSIKEYEIYKNADLKEVEINGKACLVRSDIDMDQKDADGITNRERIERGRSPITKDGEVVELHHIGQKSDSPLAELTTQEHRGKGNDTILHDKTKESEINRREFDNERTEHWKTRAESGNLN